MFGREKKENEKVMKKALEDMPWFCRVSENLAVNLSDITSIDYESKIVWSGNTEYQGDDKHWSQFLEAYENHQKKEGIRELFNELIKKYEEAEWTVITEYSGKLDEDRKELEDDIEKMRSRIEKLLE
ncbi:hypothetical protein MMB75_25460 [Paenibacillus sp. P2(2022)]|uniref:hypothetical protein n=1 Tax=Paenibacillus sp. P2(2022) TaxID=2917813 RepID=UPI002405063B|nr:hypothetical protein [Paenibacillus sp. P2(2022)]MDG0056977.1 hypothetical protein [Paenibacillus sp. P2(2022)]